MGAVPQYYVWQLRTLKYTGVACLSPLDSHWLQSLDLQQKPEENNLTQEFSNKKYNFYLNLRSQLKLYSCIANQQWSKPQNASLKNCFFEKYGKLILNLIIFLPSPDFYYFVQHNYIFSQKHPELVVRSTNCGRINSGSENSEKKQVF